MPEKVTFSNGRTENVYTVPQLLLARLDALPEYQIGADNEIDVVMQKQHDLEAAKSDLAYLLAFKDVKVPTEWEFPDEARAAGLDARDGIDGRKVDYIENEILTTGKDAIAAQAAMFALTDKEVDAAASLFRPCRFARICPFSKSRRKK